MKGAALDLLTGWRAARAAGLVPGVPGAAAAPGTPRVPQKAANVPSVPGGPSKARTPHHPANNARARGGRRPGRARYRRRRPPDLEEIWNEIVKRLYGGAGLFGGVGTIGHSLFGGRGNDTLIGGAPELATSNDYLDGGPGDDLLDGMKGADTLIDGTQLRRRAPSARR